MDTSDVVANSGNTPVQPVSVGRILREAREQLGLSVDDIAERTKFAPRQVEALEADDFAHLPQTTFLRGFVRSYARVLQLDEAALLAALPVEQANAAPARRSGVTVPFPSAQSLQGVNLAWLLGALGVAFLLGIFVWWHEETPKSQPSQLVVESLALPSAESGAAAAVTEATSAAEAAEPAAPAQPSQTAAPLKSTEPVAATAPAVAAASAPVAVKPVVPIEMLRRRPMHFVFSEEAWAEVIDVNGNVLLSRTNPAGSEQWIGGPRRAPYDVSIAHPATVKLYYKGKEIDLSPYATMEVAHLKVE